MLVYPLMGPSGRVMACTTCQGSGEVVVETPEPVVDPVALFVTWGNAAAEGVRKAFDNAFAALFPVSDLRAPAPRPKSPSWTVYRHQEPA